MNTRIFIMPKKSASNPTIAITLYSYLEYSHLQDTTQGLSPYLK